MMLSQKLIYNIPNRVGDLELEHIDTVTTMVEAVMGGAQGTPFGHLHLVVRDYANFAEGATLEACRQEMAGHLNEHMNASTEEEQERAARLKDLFKSINCH